MNWKRFIRITMGIGALVLAAGLFWQLPAVDISIMEEPPIGSIEATQFANPLTDSIMIQTGRTAGTRSGAIRFYTNDPPPYGGTSFYGAMLALEDSGGSPAMIYTMDADAADATVHMRHLVRSTNATFQRVKVDSAGAFTVYDMDIVGLEPEVYGYGLRCDVSNTDNGEYFTFLSYDETSAEPGWNIYFLDGITFLGSDTLRVQNGCKEYYEYSGLDSITELGDTALIACTGVGTDSSDTIILLQPFAADTGLPSGQLTVMKIWANKSFKVASMADAAISDEDAPHWFFWRVFRHKN